MPQVQAPESLVVESEGPIRRVRLNRPEVRNALDPKTIEGLTTLFRNLAKDKDVRAVVLGGRGPDFCAGADIEWMRKAGELTPAQAERDATRLLEMCRAIDEAPFLVIARIHGNCYGGGLGLTAAADIVVAASDARFCFSEVRLGILPAVVSTFVVPKIGTGQARRWFLTSEVFDAPTAERIGLAHSVVDAEALDGECERYARSVLKNGPNAVGLAKAYLRRMGSLTRDQRLKHSAKVLAKIRTTAEAKEGFQAFLEKRPPNWAK